MTAEQLAELLDRFISFGDVQRDTSVLWILHAWTVKAHYTTPRLLITSPERECGKSVLMDVLGELVPRPLKAMNASAAAVYRSLADEPTVLMDELDQTLAQDNDRTRDLQAVLNSGYRRGQSVPRCEGPKSEVRHFPTFAPVVFSGLETKLNGPFMSRTIPIRMRRGKPSKALMMSPAQAGEFEMARNRCLVWADGAQTGMLAQEVDLPEGLEGRAAELWVPLFAVADQLGGDWPERARQACAALTLWNPPAEDSPAHRVLEACEWVWPEDEDIMSCASLCDRLNRLEGEDFDQWGKNGLTVRMVGLNLAKYDVHSEPFGHGSESYRGFRRENLALAWATYCTERDKKDSLLLSLFHTSSVGSQVTAFSPTKENPSPTDNGQQPTEKDAPSDRSVIGRNDDSSVGNDESQVGNDDSSVSELDSSVGPTEDLYGGLAGPNDHARFTK